MIIKAYCRPGFTDEDGRQIKTNISVDLRDLGPVECMMDIWTVVECTGEGSHRVFQLLDQKSIYVTKSGVIRLGETTLDHSQGE